MIRNLGQVAAIYIGSSAPGNTNLIWLDNTVVPFVFRAYDGSAWSELATHKWVRAYVDGWLVTLPPRQLADDGDYMLINSNNVNYKITVKDFVKSAVGNPLDFKGIIRVSADFPNPSTLESGDMYVIITSPVGGTVTDPYSGKTFEDSEKIVWDEVTRSWESLGKINITVNLTTSYSETEVTIHSSAGKETTIQGATDQLAGVMLPGQYSWLQALSNGSIVPGDPSPLTPLTPAHKHNYNDIINRLVSQQGTGESTIDPMSQKATTDALNLKFDKASVLQVSGAATDKVMSQKAVTDALKTLSDDFNNKLTNYLPLAGGTMKGRIVFSNNQGIRFKNAAGSESWDEFFLSGSNTLNIGNTNNADLIISTGNYDIKHNKAGTSYKIWDASNLPTPASTTDLTNYLPLAGGTMTGSIIFPNRKGIFGTLTDGTSNIKIAVVNVNNNVEIGNSNTPLMLVSNSTDLTHYRDNNTYKIWDKFNLPDPVTLSGNNVFTGNNTFQGGKFNVGPFEVTSSGSLLSNINTPTGSAWSRSLVFRANNDIPSSLVFGGYNSVDNTNLGYAYIGIGDVNSSTAQYKFRPASLEVPIAWSLDDPNGNALVWSQSSTLAHLGRASGTTKIRSGNVNLIHTKGTTDYTILDSSNYTEFLPQNIAWTYGFVSHAVNNDGYDANSMIGVDKPKLLFNYYTRGKIVNAPTGMGYGNVLQIDGPYTSSYNEAALKTQLAFDIIHNVDNGTGSMWYRTANNKGMAVANWRRVLTAEENVARLSFDGNNYPAIIRVDGTTYPWLRANGNGFLPNVEKSLASGGASQLGSSSWAFLAGYIATVHTNTISFTNFSSKIGSTGNAIRFLSSSDTPFMVNVGKLLVSNNYDDTELSLIPINGIYSKGNIRTSSAILFLNNTWTNDLAPNRNSAGYLQVLDAYNASSDGGPANCGTVLQVNSRNAHWANQLWFPGGAEASKKGLYYRHMPYNSTTYGEWIKLATTSDLGNYLPLSGGTLSGNLTINTVGSTTFVINNNDTNGSETFMRVLRKGTASAAIGFRDSLGAYIYNYNSNKYLFIDNDGYARVGTTSGSTRLALITDIPTVSGYLPLTGGTLTGTLSINSGGSEPLIINNSASAGEAYVVTKTQGTTRGVMGWNSSLGMFLQDNRGYTFSVKADGVYFGASSSTLTKLLTSADLSSYATQSWCNGQFAPLSRFNTSTGYTTIKVIGQEFNFDSTTREIYMNYRTLSGSTAVTKITWKGGSNSTLCEGRWGNLYMNDNLVATQSWAAEKFPNKTGAGASGTWGISITGNATTATTASKLGSTTIGGSAKPIYLSSGTPTACSATVGSATVPVYMNAGTITQCSTTLGVSITGNAATATNSTQLGGTAASSYVKANDNISRLTNDSGYTTQEWVNSQNFVKSTSTKKVTDIQPVDALPATQASGVLYLVFG